MIWGMDNLFNVKFTKKLNIQEYNELAKIDDIKEIKDLKNFVGEFKAI